MEEYYGILKRHPDLVFIANLIDSRNTSFSNSFFDANMVGRNCVLNDKRRNYAYFYIKGDGLRRFRFYCNDKLLGIIPRAMDASFGVFCGNYRNNKVLEFNIFIGEVDNSEIYSSYLIRFVRDNIECYVLKDSYRFVIIDNLKECEVFSSSRFKISYWTQKDIFLNN